VRKIGVIAIWFCLALGITQLIVLSMEEVMNSARMPHQMMAYRSPDPLLTRTNLAQMPYRP
jgi:hypothetical protein